MVRCQNNFIMLRRILRWKSCSDTALIDDQSNGKGEQMVTDPYAALGLTKTATAAEIKKAYRKLVRTSHPDLHPDDPGAEARFKAVTAAHDLLKDADTRARFDAGEIDEK